MRNTFRMAVLLACLAALLSSVGFAQGPEQGSNPFSQMREKYKYTFQLMGMVRHVDAINKDPKYKLTSAQAKQVIGVLQPLRNKEKLTQDQAKDALKGLKKVFTVDQLNAMARIKERPQNGQHRMGGGRPGGQGGPGGGQHRFNANAMKDFNPFYAKASGDDEFSKKRAERWNKFFCDLDKQAKNSKAVKSVKVKKVKAAKTSARQPKRSR